MNKTDFYRISYFTEEEIIKTGAKIEDIDFELIHKLDKVRDIIGIPIHLLENGLTSGEHSSPLHRQGKAVDFYVKGITHDQAVRIVLECASMGFKHCGVYWNGVQYSFHMALGNQLKTWFARKDKYNNWTYSGLEFKRN